MVKETDMKVEIIGIDKAKLLLDLYNKANCQGKNFDDSPMSKRIGILNAKNKGTMELAEQLIAESQDYIFDNVDLGAGSRPLKISLDGFEIDTSSYDDYHGAGLGESVVQKTFDDMLKQIPASELQSLMNINTEEEQNDSLAMIRTHVDTPIPDDTRKKSKTMPDPKKM
jgi:hypothetical protein